MDSFYLTLLKLVAVGYQNTPLEKENDQLVKEVNANLSFGVNFSPR